jgi:diguanylate cyclase (GGDEF)-like protein
MQLFVPAIWIGSGICLFAGGQFCVFGLIRRQERVFLAFGFLCLLIGIYMPFSARWYHAETIQELAMIARFEMAIICLIYPAYIWFMHYYSYEKKIGPFHLIATISFAVLFIINLWSPNSFLYVSISSDTPITLPWGEVVNDYKLQTASIAWFYYAASYTVFVWAFYRCFNLWRDRYKIRALSITIYLLLQLFVIVHGELIDNLNLNSVYFGEFVFLALVVLVAGTMVLELRSRSLALEQSIESLRKETSRRKEYQDKLNYIAHHDYLTDLPNRRALAEQLNTVVMQCSESNSHGAMLLIDLDHFKMINDSLGHDLGDTLLQLVAQRLTNIRPDGELPVRLGGDEFAVICGGLPAHEDEAEENAIQVAGQISDALLKPYRIAEHELVIGASVGIAIFKGDTRDISDIMKRADMALYRAKSAGRNSIRLFAPSLKREVEQRHIIERYLRIALEQGELELHFQPQVDVHDNVIGAEVLSRWYHPELGQVPPIQFITVAEESGLIHLLGEFVMWRSCQYLKTWQDSAAYCPMRLSINISPWQIENPGFVNMVRKALDISGIDPKSLTIEITESTFMRDIQSVTQKIRTLKEQGVAFSIDDFGTGYSALAWLKKLSLNELKIDKVFIHDMLFTASDKLIDTILAIARNLDLRVVAEGVETQAQRNALETLGCRYFQGFLFAQALPETEYLNWVRQRVRHAG